MSNVLEKLNPMSLSMLGLGVTVVGFILSKAGDAISTEQNTRMISAMVKEEVAKQLNRG